LLSRGGGTIDRRPGSLETGLCALGKSEGYKRAGGMRTGKSAGKRKAVHDIVHLEERVTLVLGGTEGFEETEQGDSEKLELRASVSPPCGSNQVMEGGRKGSKESPDRVEVREETEMV